MPRYIDADAERVKYKRDFDLLWNNPAISPEARDAIKHLHVAIQSALQNAPTADVAPVVRCKDCQKWMPEYCITEHCGICSMLQETVGAQFYCAYAVRKEGGKGDD